MRRKSLSYWYNYIKECWEDLPKNVKATYHNDLVVYVHYKARELLQAEETLEGDSINVAHQSAKLMDAVACGYVQVVNGEYVMAPNEPTWVHPDRRS